MNNKAIGIALLVAGIIALVFGIQASQSVSSDVSRVFTGSPTDKATWLLVGGAAATAAGLFLTLKGRSRP